MAGAQSGNILDRYDLNTGTFPHIMDVIHNVDYMKYPFQRKAGRGKAKQTYVTWGIDDLAAAADNEWVDGAEFASQSLDVAETIGNYCQISMKHLKVSRRADIVSKVGRMNEMKYQIAKKAKELKRDIERTLLLRRAARVGSGSEAPRTAGVGAWIRTNIKQPSAGNPTAPGLSGAGDLSGFPDAAGTQGTAEALKLSTIEELARDCHKQGAEPEDLFMHPDLHLRLSRYLYGSNVPVAQQYQEQGKTARGTTVISHVEALEIPFGTLMINSDLYMPSGTNGKVYLLDMDYWDILYLSPYHIQRMGKSGDHTRRSLVVDYALCSKNEKSSGQIAAVNTNSAVVA